MRQARGTLADIESGYAWLRLLVSLALGLAAERLVADLFASNEWLGWLAYPVIGLEILQPLTWLSLTAPVVMYVLLTRISGVPPLEEAMLASRGDAYRAYQKRVSPFFPLPPKGQKS